MAAAEESQPSEIEIIEAKARELLGPQSVVIIKTQPAAWSDSNSGYIFIFDPDLNVIPDLLQEVENFATRSPFQDKTVGAEVAKTVERMRVSGTMEHRGLTLGGGATIKTEFNVNPEPFRSIPDDSGREASCQVTLVDNRLGYFERNVLEPFSKAVDKLLAERGNAE